MAEIEKANQNQKKEVIELRGQKKKINIKLDALRDFHAQRDIKVHTIRENKYKNRQKKAHRRECTHFILHFVNFR